MQLDVKFEDKIELKDFYSLNEIKCDVKSATQEEDTLEGEIVVTGSYYKNNMTDVNDFSKTVPFTVVFKEDYQYQNVEISSFNYFEIVNLGIECSFELAVTYDIEEKEIEDFQDDVKSEIQEKYDDLLNKILETRQDNFLEPNVSVTNKTEETRVNLHNIKETYSSYRIYYPTNEKDLEKIANVEKVGLDKIYKSNSDFSSKRRIVIK